MDENSSKPAQTGNPEVKSLQLTLEWLDREGGQQRNARVLRELVNTTLTAVLRGEPPPDEDTTTLRALFQELEGVVDSPLKAFRASELGNWWGSRQEQIRQKCAQEGCALTPHLIVKKGGGRGLPSRLSFEFLPTTGAEPEDDDASSEIDPNLVRYQMDPVKPALWIRLTVGSRPFPVQSWRGYVLIGSAALNIALIGLTWYGLYASWTTGHPVTTAALAHLGVMSRDVVLAPARNDTVPIQEVSVQTACH